MCQSDDHALQTIILVLFLGKFDYWMPNCEFKKIVVTGNIHQPLNIEIRVGLGQYLKLHVPMIKLHKIRLKIYAYYIS